MHEIVLYCNKSIQKIYPQLTIIKLQYFQPADMLLFALVKRTYKSWLNCELAMENAPSRASKVLKIMDSIDELIELELEMTKMSQFHRKNK